MAHSGIERSSRSRASAPAQNLTGFTIQETPVFEGGISSVNVYLPATGGDPAWVKFLVTGDECCTGAASLPGSAGGKAALTGNLGPDAEALEASVDVSLTTGFYKVAHEGGGASCTSA